MGFLGAGRRRFSAMESCEWTLKSDQSIRDSLNQNSDTGIHTRRRRKSFGVKSWLQVNTTAAVNFNLGNVS